MLGQQSPPKQATSSTDIMAMLQQGAQQTAVATQPAHHAASAPNLMAMLNIQPAVPAPAVTAQKKSQLSHLPRVPSAPAVVAPKPAGGVGGPMLLTPERLAAMVAANSSAGHAPQTQPTARSSKLRSVLGVGSGAVAATVSPMSKAPVVAPQDNFALLLRKLETSA